MHCPNCKKQYIKARFNEENTVVYNCSFWINRLGSSYEENINFCAGHVKYDNKENCISYYLPIGNGKSIDGNFEARKLTRYQERSFNYSIDFIPIRLNYFDEDIDKIIRTLEGLKIFA